MKLNMHNILGLRTKGRLMNYAHKSDQRCNVASVVYNFVQFGKTGVLFYATRDIEAFEELKWDYGDKVCKVIFLVYNCL